MPYERNIKLLFSISGLAWMRFFLPVMALFYIANKVPVEQFAIIMAVFALTVLLFEIPSGVLSDMLGRRKTIIISRLFVVVEMLIFTFCDGFYPFLIAKILSGIGVSLLSGTNTALLYETLQKLKREKEHKIISGKLAVVTSLVMAVVFITGSFLFQIHPKLPVYATLPFITLAFILTFFLVDPYPSKHTITLKKSWGHFRQGLSYFAKHKKIVALTLYSLPIATTISISLSLSSAYLYAVSIPLVWIGSIAFVGSLSTAFGSKKAHVLEEKLGERIALLTIQIIIFVAVILMMFAVPYYGAIFYLLIPLTAGFFHVILNHSMNTHVLKTHRATMLSIRNMFDNLGVFLLFPLVGHLVNASSYFRAYGVLFVLLVVGALASYFVRKNAN